MRKKVRFSKKDFVLYKKAIPSFYASPKNERARGFDVDIDGEALLLGGRGYVCDWR